MFITNKNITESLVRSLQNSFTSQTNCEITLMCEGKTLKCHRHVLVLHSTHFNNLFKEQTNFPSAIVVVNMKFSHLKAMVDYMYFGRIKLQEDSDEMNQIIKCAEDLGLSALVTFITEFLKNSSKHKSMNGSSANLSNNDLNGDDSLLKRKRASDVSSRVLSESFKKPKLNESLNKTSTPLRDTKSAANSDVKVSNSDNSETLIHDKKRKSDDDEADDEDRRIKEEDERRKKKEEEDRKRKEEQDRKRKEEEKQRIEEERRKKAEEDKRKAAEEHKRKAEETERIRLEEEKNKKALEKKKEEEAAKKAEEEKNKKETTKCDESASTKSCAVCNKQYKDNIDHRKVLEGITFEKKCIINGCSKSLPFRRALIDHLLKAHKIDVCDD